METDNEIKTVADFIKSVFEKISTFEKGKEKDQIFWFRGEGNSKFNTSLIPSSYRGLAATIINSAKIDDNFISKKVKHIEMDTDCLFSIKALPYLNDRAIDNTIWNRYFLMQHYKINTRLLDWTENCLLALFFSLTDPQSKDKDAKVWILRPFELNNRTIQIILKSEKECKIIPSVEKPRNPCDILNDKGDIRLSELTRRYLEMDFKSHEEEDILNVYHPLAIYPPYLDERMVTQKTCFTIFGNKINGLRTLPVGNRKVIDSVVVPSESKESILKELNLLGIDYSSIYPDLDGLGISINREFREEFLSSGEILPHIFNCLRKASEEDHN